MARMHAGKKGKAGSKRPVKADLSFVSIKPKEVEKIILDLAKDAVKPSKIGMILRDSYGVPSVKAYLGKTINDVLVAGKQSLAIPEDLQALVSKAQTLKKHILNNKKDLHNKRGLILVESKIRRLVKYYKSVGKIAPNWSYE